MWDLAVREDDFNAAESMVSRMKSPPLSMQALLVYARGDTAARAAMLERARVLDARQSQIAARYVATFLLDFAAAETLARLDVQERRRPAIRLGAQTFLAWLEVARGRWNAAKSAFEVAQNIPEASSLLPQRALAASLPFLAVPASDLEAIRAEVAAWNPNAAALEPNAGLAARLERHLRLYVLGLLSSRLGDVANADRFAAEMDRTPAPTEARDVVRGLAQTVRADIAVQRGRTGDVLPSDAGAIPLELVSAPLFANVREYTLEHARYLRALQLRANGQYAEALRWVDASFQGSPSEVVYLAPVHLLRAEIHEQLGNRELALEQYGRFVTLWRDCDLALQPRLKEAQATIARLERSRG